MRKLLVIAVLALSIAACGGDGEPTASEPSPTATAHAEEEAPHALEGYSEGVRKYYGEPHEHAEGDVEAEFHQPPTPPEAGLGDTITLTGSNIGVRLEVTLESVKAAGGRTQVRLGLENTGIAVYEAPLQNAVLTDTGGTAANAVADEGCSRNFDPAALRIDVGRERTVCMLFDGDGTPERLQLALESVPAEAGGIWNLN